MQVGSENRQALRKGSDVPKAAGLGQADTQNPVELSDVDLRLFRAMHKVNAPKQRICSALWLSYAEYDELLKQL